MQLRGLAGKQVAGEEQSLLEQVQYNDLWANDEYLQFMYERLILLRELMSETGSIYLHCDWHQSHRLRCLMDEVFGVENFQNDIAWHYSGWNKQLTKSFERRHDSLLFYSKSDHTHFNSYFELWQSKEAYVKARRQSVRVDDDGRDYVLSDAGNGQRIKRYLDEVMQQGVVVDDVWNIDKLNNSAKEGMGYPTQKPEPLLERIIKASSSPGLRPDRRLQVDPRAGLRS